VVAGFYLNDEQCSPFKGDNIGLQRRSFPIRLKYRGAAASDIYRGDPLTPATVSLVTGGANP